MITFNGIGSLFIACVELLLILNLLIVAEKNKLNKIAFLILTLLFAYQAAEFVICYFNLRLQYLNLLAFVIITFLPPLGLYFILSLLEYDFKWQKLIFFPYLIFIFIFLFSGIEVTRCSPLFAVYKYSLGFIYGLFYYLPIILVIFLLIVKLKTVKDKIKRKMMIILLIGFTLSFVPIIFLKLISSTYRIAVESLVCKQALLLALALAYFILTNKIGIKEDAGNSN